MGIRETIQDILTQLATITVTNGDGQSVALHSDVFNNQVEREIQGGGAPYPKPAAFVEVQLSEGMPLGGNITGYECVIRILVAHQMMNEEGVFDQNLNVIDVVDKIQRKLNGAKIANCSPLYRGTVTMDTDHGSVYLKVLEYKTYFTDATSSDTDVLNDTVIVSELDNPTLGLAIDLVPVIEEEPTNPPPPLLLDIIELIQGNASGLNEVYLTITGNYTALSEANTVYIIFVNAAAVITLPTAIANTSRYIIKKITSGSVSVVFSSGQNADGSTTVTLTKQYEALEFRPNPDTNNFNIF